MSTPILNLDFRDLSLTHHICLGIFSVLRILCFDTDHRSVDYGWMLEDHGFDLGRRHLEATTFDQLFLAIDDIPLCSGRSNSWAVLASDDIAGSKVSFRIEGGCIGYRVLVVLADYRRTTDQKFACSS